MKNPTWCVATHVEMLLLALFSYLWRTYAGVISGAEFLEPALTLRRKSYENSTDKAQVQ